MHTEEHHISVRRTARYCTIGATNRAVRHVWFACHGYGQLAQRFAQELAPLANEATLVVVPEALSRAYLRGTGGTVGASWMTREDRLHEIADYVAYLDAVYAATMRDVDRSACTVTVLGFSQGAATAGRWAVQGAHTTDRLLLAGGLLAPEIDLTDPTSPLRTTTVGYMIGTEYDLVDRDELRQQQQILRHAGITTHMMEFTGGHRLDIPTMLAFQA